MLVVFGDEGPTAEGGRAFAFADAHPAATAVEYQGHGRWFPEPGRRKQWEKKVVEAPGARSVSVRSRTSCVSPPA